MLRKLYKPATPLGILALSACASFNPTDPYGLTPEELAAEPPEDSITYAQSNQPVTLEQACPELQTTELAVIKSAFSPSDDVAKGTISGEFNLGNSDVQNVMTFMGNNAANPDRPAVLLNFGYTFGSDPNALFAFTDLMAHYGRDHIVTSCNDVVNGNGVAAMLSDDFTIATTGCQPITGGNIPIDNQGYAYIPEDGVEGEIWSYNSARTRRLYEANTDLSPACLDTLLNPTEAVFLPAENALKLGIGVDAVLGPNGTLIIRAEDRPHFTGEDESAAEDNDPRLSL